MLVHEKKNISVVFRSFILLAFLICLLYTIYLLAISKVPLQPLDLSLIFMPALICFISDCVTRKGQTNASWFLMFILFPASITARFLYDYINGLQSISILLAIVCMFLVRKKIQVLLGFFVSMASFIIMHLYLDYKVNISFHDDLAASVFGYVVLTIGLFYALLYLRNLLDNYHIERSKALIQLNESNNSLDKKNREIEQKLKLLAQKNKIISNAAEFHKNLTTILSHDIKGSILPLKYLLHNMRYNYVGKEDFEIYVQRLELEIERLYMLHEEILNLASTTGQQDYITKTNFSVSELIDKTIQESRVPIAGKSLRVTSNIPGCLNIYANANLFKIVLRNLLSNAIKFSYPLGNIFFDVEEGDRSLRLIIRDHGVGIRKENIRKIMDGEYIQTSGTEKEKGTGLGLKFCKDIVDRLNGELKISSELGKGTKVTLVMPKK